MVDENNLENAYVKAKETLKMCATKNGLYASGGKDGYKGVWARDSIISLMGASSDSDELFQEQFKKSLKTLKKYQSKHGQIANAILGFEEKKIKAEFSTVDSSLWFVIGHYFYMKRYKDKTLFNKHKKAIEKAFTWLTYQEIQEDGVIRQLPTTDWQDAFPHKYGGTINTAALHYRVLSLLDKRKELTKLSKTINKTDDKKLWKDNFYLPYRWKNHNKYKELGYWFDSLGNLLAIIFDLADSKQKQKIFSHIKKKKINLPYPLKAIDPPIKKGSKDWQDYYLDCDAGTPHHYLNGGIWPFIGGFYILALIKCKKYKEAEEGMELLAESNLKGNSFPEWVDPITKKSYGIYQAWSAGMYICAYNSLKKKKVLF